MLESSLEELAQRVDESALVLDVGGWIKPLTRADWVLDLMPYATRAAHGRDGAGPERFTEQTWVQRDICHKEPWPFTDDQFDFVVCSHTLEDIRDPIWVCSELTRVAKAGYIEVPSRLDEQTMGVQGGPWVGWGHHHWLIDVEDNRLDFVFKPHIIGRPGNYFPPDFVGLLTAEDRVHRLWWDGTFDFEERFLFAPGELDAYLSEFVTHERRRRGYPDPSEANRVRRSAALLRRTLSR